MKSVGAYIVAALVLAALGVVALAGGLVERRLAQAYQTLASLDFVETAAAYDELEQELGYARYVPWVAGDGFNRIRARRAAVRYWDGDYDALLDVARDADAGENTDTDVRFIAANAVYRVAQERASDRQSILRVLDEALAAYAAVLRGSPGSEDAAFNYEYVTRVRDEIATGRRRALSGPPESGRQPVLGKQTLHGREGGPPKGPGPDEFKIHVPMNEEERGKGSEAGSDQVRRRQG